MSSFITIRRINISDIDALQRIGKQTFYETFADYNSKEDMANYLAESFSIEKLSAELEHPESEFYLAIINHELTGYLKLNFGSAQTEFKDNTSMEIERIYVLSSFHGKQVGQALFDQAIRIALDRKITGVWLGVWEKNLRAIRFYQKNGFTEFGQHVFQLGHDAQTDILMKRSLISEM